MAVPRDFRRQLTSNTHTASGCPSLGARYSCNGPMTVSSEHRPDGDAHRFGEILSVAPLLGLHQQGETTMLAGHAEHPVPRPLVFGVAGELNPDIRVAEMDLPSPPFSSGRQFIRK